MMFYSCDKYLISSFIIAACCLQHCCLGQSTTVRPYKFGFTIDEQQHRREMRDERGIVMGEFGFITADGIYHVTVYATDEQGRFRILAMRNYPYESPPKTIEVMVQPKAAPATTTTKKPLTRHNFNTEACSGCFLANGNNKPKGSNDIEGKTSQIDVRLSSKDFPNASGSSATNANSPSKTPSTASDTTAQGGSTSSSKSQPPSGKLPPIMDIIMQEVLPTLMGKKGQTSATNPSQATALNNKPNALPANQKPSSSSAGFDNASKKSTGSSSTSNANDDGDLYRFKYILDYHGHTETGKRNGNKEGSYFVIGDDNVERSIEYVANELGYQPRIRWRKLNSNEIKPKENTLKDYEFVWFQK